jgi:dihydrofolate reductase
MSGSVSIVGQLLAAGLLDELHLLVHPIAVRKGICTSSTSQPDRLPPAPTTTQRGTCPSLLTN